MKPILFNFIIPKNSGYELSQLQSGTLSDFKHLYCQGEYSWVLQTYHAMKMRGLHLKLSYELDPDAINLAHGNILLTLPKKHNCFCVSLQADYPRFPLAHCHVVQNQAQVGANSIFVPHWPQIGQVTRKSTRRGVSRVAYQGAADFTDLDVDRINSDLKAHDISFDLLNEDRWPELGDVDILVGIRQFGKRDYRRKPPTKMVNAWNSEIPFIGGWDSAYVQIGEPDADYLRVSSYEEMIKRILELNQNPELYSRLVEAGRKQAKIYCFEEISLKWETLLERDVAESFRCWQVRRGHEISYRLRHYNYIAWASLKSGFRSLYRIGAIKRMRDMYYDPVK